MSFENGSNVGPYRIIEQLGQGGMATVYKAYHPALDRYVAIKVLHQAFKEDPNFLARFQREARVVAKIDHPNIVPVYDFSEHEGQPYLVMKFIEGKTLKARLQAGPLNKQEALAIIEAMGGALDYAHGLGILHRDIKPSNVLIEEDGDVYLADFGLARIAQRGTSTLSSDVMLGTPQYISPEQARGESNLDNGTDIYSFGVVLYEMVVGRVPFNADTPFSIIHDHIYTPLPLPHSLNPKVPQDVERVLLKALAKDRNDRFKTVGELVDAFNDAVTGKPLDMEDVRVEESTLALPEQAATEPPHAKPKRRLSWIWIAAGLVIALFSLIGFLGALGDARFESRSDSVTEEIIEEVRLSEEDQARIDTLLNEIQSLDEADTEGASIRHIEIGNVYRDNGIPFNAAKSYAEALYLSDGILLRDPAFTEDFVMVLFLAAPHPRAAELFTQLRREYPQWTDIVPLHARALMHRDQIPGAERILLPYMEEHPDDPIGLAVLAEYNLMLEDQETAKSVLIELDQYRLPDWLRMYVEDLRESF